LAEVMKKQGEQLVHVSNLFLHPHQAELAGELVKRTGPGKVFSVTAERRRTRRWSKQPGKPVPPKVDMKSSRL
jgi:hypothetical protein